MLSSKILLVLILAVEYIDGNQKTIIVGDDGFSTSGDDDNSEMCCVHGNCSCNSLDQALANLTSNVMINITTDATLSSLVTATNLENVSIIGHINPIVNCGSAGRIHLTSCHNCIIQGIVWNGYGIKNPDNVTEPMLKLNKSSNVTVQNCTFQNLIGQAIVLSEVSGEMNINDCNFVNNSYYRDHGAIIYYVVSQYSQLLFTISNCNFTHNKGAKSLVYIENKDSDFDITFHHSKFCYNQGTSIYVVNQRVYFTGKVLFQYNTAKNGAGIYITQDSSVVFSKNSNAAFIQNTADYMGGAVFLRNHSNILFDQDSKITFEDNSATNGTIYSEVNSNVTFKGNCNITFNSNSATEYGEALYSSDNSHFKFTENCTVKFINHSANSVPLGESRSIAQECIVYSTRNSYITIGGNSTIMFSENDGILILLGTHSQVSFEGASNTVLSNNSAGYYGGAITSFNHSCLSFKGNSTTLFINNSADRGGAIMSFNHSYISFEGTSTTMFINNRATYFGGAIMSFNHSYISFKTNSAANSKVGCDDRAINFSDYGQISFEETSTTMFINNSADHGGAIYSFDNSHISFEGTSITIFYNNNVNYFGGAIRSFNHNYISFKAISTTMFCNNSADQGGAIYSRDNSYISFGGASTTKFNNNRADHGGAIKSFDQSHISFEGTSTSTFSNNSANYFGGAIMSFNHSYISFKGNSTVNNKAGYDGGVIYSLDHDQLPFERIFNTTFSNNSADHGGAIYSFDHSNVSFEGTSSTIFYNNSVNYFGGSIWSFNHSYISFKGNSKTMFIHNSADHGGAMYSFDNGHISFEGTSITIFYNNNVNYFGGAIRSFNHNYISFKAISTTMFCNNSADQGGAIYSRDSSYISFEGASTTKFSNNRADHGGAIKSFDQSHIYFEGTSTSTFSNNSANYFGGAIMSFNHSYISFKGNSTVNNKAGYDGGVIYSLDHDQLPFERIFNTTFSNNSADHGGAIYSFDHSNVSFEGTSSTIFYNNSVNYFGGSIWSFNHSYISFKENSKTMFIHNSADHGGAIYSFDNGHISFEGTSTTVFSNNSVIHFGGAIISFNHGYISFKGNSTTLFNNNSADHGGAIYSFNKGHISFEGDSTTMFNNNSADYQGGAISCIRWGYLSFKGNSDTSFSNNTADNGGAVNFEDCNISFEENSTTMFEDNNALQGGAMFSIRNGSVSFKEYCSTKFNDNKATDGGALFCRNCIVLLKGNSSISSAYNEAVEDGGVMHFTSSSKILFSEFTNVTLKKNRAINGGALFASDNSTICFEGHALVTFTENTAGRNGGAVYFNMHCIVTWTQNASVIFEKNDAVFGGAVCLNRYTRAVCKSNSAILFENNTVISEGGAISILTDSSITVKDSTVVTFTINNALYGGAMFFDRTNTTLTFNNNTPGINFTRNTARIAGNNMYFDLIRSGQNCLNNRAFGVADEIKRHIVTPPSKLELYDPAKCISYYNKMKECDQYYISHLMLGEEIIIPVCLRDYCNEPSYSTQRFTIREFSKPNYVINGSTEFLLSCQSDALQDIRIIGNESLTKSLNYSFDVTLNIYGNSNWKQVSVYLTIQLTPCYPGFWQYPESQKCDCCNASGIISCSGSSSTIKKGYWFGSVNGEPTVSVCPINYCNFTCCGTSNGYYQLSPVRDNQCRSHRTGTACGSCTDGYTLSFDSTECINTDNCTTGQTILVILLTVTYWIIMVTLVFAMMYYKVEIGYLYSITYYYSIVDILLSQNLQTSRGLYVIVSIISSFSKIIPQFLGELCLTTGMSGIDQQFIHYIHPSAVILILVIIIVLAKRSRRISTIISRGIIHVICLLLLLSYTSIASTSLLLLGLLQFHDINEVYTYLSPDIKYFNGRHLAYGIVALVCTASIVIGLPLLLMLEPFLNHKLNFVKIKPLLDQFQGCYKDKYRCFAGFYMICRLLVITIIIINSFNTFIADYLLISACLLIALIHLMFKPYNNKTLNKLDGMILQTIVLVAALPLLDDGFDSAFVTTIAFVLVFLPLIIFIITTLYLHKNHLKKLIMRLLPKDDPLSINDVIHNEIAMRNFDLVIDDSVRQNATVCDV